MKDLKIKTKQKEYLPGEKLLGKVVLKLDKPLKHDGLLLTAKGEELLLTKMSTGARPISDIKTNTILEQQWELEEEGTFEPGSYSFPFSFEIPEDAPPTSHGQWGRIEYLIRARLDIPRWPDLKAKKIVIVLDE